MIWITSDTHFNHLNILKYEAESRPFETIEEMNETIIRNWNSCVKPEDTIYVVGDFFMGPLEGIEPILNRLNGHIILIRGNHDTKARLEMYRSHGIEVKDIEYIQYKGRFFILCHFPIASPEFIKMVRADNAETVILYGHIHHNAPTGYVNGTYHIGMDTNNLTPVSLTQIWQEVWPKDAEEVGPQTYQEIMSYKEEHQADVDEEAPTHSKIKPPRCPHCKYKETCHSYDYNNHCVMYKTNFWKNLFKRRTK